MLNKMLYNTYFSTHIEKDNQSVHNILWLQDYKLYFLHGVNQIFSHITYCHSPIFLSTCSSHSPTICPPPHGSYELYFSRTPHIIQSYSATEPTTYCCKRPCVKWRTTKSSFNLYNNGVNDRHTLINQFIQ